MRALITPSRSKKIARCFFAASVGILVATKDKTDGPANDHKIEQEGPVLNVIKIVLDTALHGLGCFRCAAPAIDLRPTSDARLYEMAYHVLRDHIPIIFCVLQHVRTRTNNGHIATQHIPKLRKFIKARCTQEAADDGAAWIGIGSLGQIGLVVRAHRAEFVARECFATKSSTRLLEENGSRRTELDRDRTDNIYDREDQREHGETEGNIERALGNSLRPFIEWRFAGADDRETPDLIDCARIERASNGRSFCTQERHTNAAVLAFIDKLRDRLFACLRHGDEYFVDVLAVGDALDIEHAAKHH